MAQPLGVWTALAALRGVALVAVILLGLPPRAGGQTLLEFRGADTKYRYVDCSYTSRQGAVFDAFYVGVPGSNELNLGGGYAITRGHLVLTPLVYAVIGREGGQRGVKIALLASYEHRGWKLLSFVGDYLRVSGAVSSYQVLDTLDVTRTVVGRWEAGIQSGFFHADDAWGPQVGPLVRLNDRLGAWAASYRFGPQREFRVARVLAF